MVLERGRGRKIDVGVREIALIRKRGRDRTEEDVDMKDSVCLSRFRLLSVST